MRKWQTTLASENRPLPHLPADLAYKIDVARVEALVKLHDDLNTCWKNYFPSDVGKHLKPPDPTSFFPSFVGYGVAMYEARAQALLALKPSLPDYQDWLNFGLKTLICDELAPVPATRRLE